MRISDWSSDVCSSDLDAGSALGPVGASVAVKALGIHATYLVDAEAEKLKRFEQAAKLAEAAVKALPDEANSHYRHAFALGRYSQGLSIAKALKQGIAGTVRESPDEALALAPKPADAPPENGRGECRGRECKYR